MEIIRADLHIHTCLSPCADLEMTPTRIMRRAREAGIDMLAISDHNSAENLETAMEAARAAGLAFVPAMEMTTAEEAHVLGLFETVEAAIAMQEIVYRHLAPAPPRESDYQVVVNSRDEVLSFNKRGLMGATSLGLERLIDRIHALGGLAVPSHVDRQSFSLSSQFGLIPEGLAVDAFEAVDARQARALLFAYPGLAVICSSDAHRLEDIGRRTTGLRLGEATFRELALAFRGEGGRRAGCA